jgi:septum site-determining protein MinD
VTSGKGGWKTTATANIGMSIARLGYKVVVIDADIGLKNLDLLLGLENRILYTVMDVLRAVSLDQALIRDKRWKNLSLLSISKNRQRYNVTRKNMQNLVSALTNLNFQYILLTALLD